MKASHAIQCPALECCGCIIEGQVIGDLQCNECGAEYFMISKDELSLLQNSLHDIRDKAKKMVMAFPKTVKGDGAFNIPAYIVEELQNLANSPKERPEGERP